MFQMKDKMCKLEQFMDRCRSEIEAADDDDDE